MRPEVPFGWPRDVDVPPVTETDETERIRALPWRQWHKATDLDQLVQWMSWDLATEVGRLRGVRLWPAQAAALRDLYDLGYLVAPMRVGEGKTLVTLLACRVLNIPPSKAVLLVQGALRDKTRAEYPSYARDWRVIMPRLVSYSQLSRGVECIARYEPQLILADEAKNLVGTGNDVERYRRFQDYRQVRQRAGKPFAFVPLDGTMDDGRNFERMAKLVTWAMPSDAAPIPRLRKEQRLWALAMDERVKESQRPESAALESLWPLPEGAYRPGSREAAREAWGRRFIRTPGVVASIDTDRPAVPILIRTCMPEYSAQDRAIVESLIRQLRQKGELPGGVVTAGGFEVYRQLRALVMGFYDQWDPEPPAPWLIARRIWASVVRGLLAQHGTRLGIYNEMELVSALENDEIQDTDATAALAEWRQIRGTFTPRSTPRWVHHGTLRYCARWLSRTPKGVVWTDRRPFGERLSQITGIPYFSRRGKSPEGHLIDHYRGPAICSVLGCGEGHNIQTAHNQALIVSMHGRGARYEQVLGRHHRRGQREDIVIADILTVVQEQLADLMQAIADAKAICSRQQTRQILSYADKEISITPEGLL